MLCGPPCDRCGRLLNVGRKPFWGRFKCVKCGYCGCVNTIEWIEGEPHTVARGGLGALLIAALLILVAYCFPHLALRVLMYGPALILLALLIIPFGFIIGWFIWSIIKR
jgi:hypothetical protein